MKRGVLVSALVWIVGLAVFAPLGASAQASFGIAGSGSNLPLTQKLLDAWTAALSRPSVALPPSIGTAGAVKAVLDGKLVLGLASRPLKAEERAAGLMERRYARIGIVIGVHADVPDQNLTGADLTAIYAGAKTAWSDGKRIYVVAREAGDSSTAVMERLIAGFQPARQQSLAQKRWELYYTDGEAFQALKTLNGALGWADTTVLSDGREFWHPVRFEGIEPSVEHLKDGTYPLVKDLSFIYREPLPSEAERFLDFCASKAGSAVLARWGAVQP